VAHFAKIPNQGVSLCSALIPELEFKRYVDLWESTKKRKVEMTYMRFSIMEDKEDKVSSSAEKLMQERNIKPKVATEIERYFDVAGKSKQSHQMAIDTAFQKMKQTDLNSLNHARMDMAIATFFHENNISDRAVESPSFKLMLKFARLVGQDYKIPTRKGIGGPLLDINYNNIVENNKEILCRESDVFGLCWLSDGATIARMPLLNVLGLCADTPPTCVAIEDCTGHMTKGGKKDATYIADLMEDIVIKYDPEKTRTTIFWFDGASNVQKAGKILEQKFPRAYSLHGGEHVVSLFFSDISKLPAIKVSSLCLLYPYRLHSNCLFCSLYRLLC
jgi:hypothetical protein